MKRPLQEIAQAIGIRLLGDGSVEVEKVASIASASQHDLVFVEDEKYLARALESAAGAVIAGEFAAKTSGKPLLISDHPKLAFAQAARFLLDHKSGTRESRVDAHAVVHGSAQIGDGVVIDAHVSIAEN